MEKKIQDIIENNTFDQLSEQSLLELKDWCTTRDEFNQLKSLFETLSTLQQKSNLEPKKQTKESLDALFMKKHSMGKSASLFFTSIEPEPTMSTTIWAAWRSDTE